MNNIKIGSTLSYVDSHGTETLCKVVSLSGESYAIVKWLEARWNLRENIMLNRKGNKSTVAIASLR